ncbi:hypothetical protein OIU77_002160 [Salix suchowensis]|uniref:Retrotransposon Copia-like N-terminal domain-containing protein n=1 Tax=Salix suchowensis TaxID=1278906 RepID=A0ABQ9B3T9_9ROSI|nr:hypothetical protein OIU77_002160 [Salix suchowensis]
MVTAAQLQIIQSPISKLISTISASVNVKLDDANYLNWHFQLQLLLESNGIFGFVDGSNSCPASTSTEYGTHSSSSSSSVVECDAVVIWRMHDRAIMQLITATLSPIALSCAIGSTSSRELWTRLKEQFSNVSKTSIFQMKSDLQNIKKGADTISQYMLRIKEACDYLAAAGVHFADEDIVILALNGLPSEYNTFRCVVRGRESVINLRDFRSQLLAEERIVDSISPPYLTAMNTAVKTSNVASAVSSPFRGSHGSQSYPNGGYNGGYKPFNRTRGRGRFHQPQRSHINGRQHMLPAKPSPAFGTSSLPICQICNFEGHTAPTCAFTRQERLQCNICGKPNHTTWFCFYNENGPNFVGANQFPASAPHTQMADMAAMNTGFYPSQPFSQQSAIPVMHSQHLSQQPMMNSRQFYQQPVMNPQHVSQQLSHAPAMTAMHNDSPASPQVWLTDSGATNHMTPDLSNLQLSRPYPTEDTVQTADGAGLCVTNVGNSVISTSRQSHGEGALQRDVQ